MDFLNEQDNENFSSSPSPSAPLPYIQSTETDIRVNFTGQYNKYVNSQPPRQFVVQPGGEGPWSTGLFDCGTDVGNSCVTLWCPCITFGRISEIVDKGKTSCVVNGAIYALLTYLTGCGCLLSCVNRSKMREQLMLSESPCEDCLVHCCCEPCALCQEYRELQSRGFHMTLGWEGNVERQNGGVPMAPVVQGGMSR